MKNILKTFLFGLALWAAGVPLHSAGTFDLIAPKMQAFVDKGEAAGIVTLIASKDKILHLSAVGKTDLAGSRQMRPDDIFWIASMSKPITAACIGMLVDDGKLAFDDPVAKYLPEFAGKPMTLRQVLTHTSGLPEVNTRDPHLTLEQTSKRIAQEPLNFQPGSRWSYSTAGLDVMGRVVEVVSRMPFDRFLQTRMFDPLGMKDTSFWITAQKYPRMAHTYQWVPAESRLRETTISYLYGTEVTDRQRPPLGGAGLFSTAEDMARFYQMMLNKGRASGRRPPQTRDRGRAHTQADRRSSRAARHAVGPGVLCRRRSVGHGGQQDPVAWILRPRRRLQHAELGRSRQGPDLDRDVRAHREGQRRQFGRADRVSGGSRCVEHFWSLPLR